MASSIYAPWSVIAGEQPTTAKWNILGTNDGSFNTGQGFNDSIIVARHMGAGALGLIYPIGSIYTETTGTNPGTTFGFGTWVAFGQGQTLVGKAASGTFTTAGSTGGAETHWHWQTVGADGGAIYAENGGSGSGRTRVVTLDRTEVGAGHGVAGARGDGTYDASSLQPYIVVYFWQRTV